MRQGAETSAQVSPWYEALGFCSDQELARCAFGRKTSESAPGSGSVLVCQWLLAKM